MKRYIHLICLTLMMSLISHQACGQMSSGPRWDIAIVYSDGVASTMTLNLKKAGVTFSDSEKIYNQYTWSDDRVFTSPRYGYYREENGIIYHREGESEYPVIDCSLKVGDSFAFRNGTKWVVKEVGTMTFLRGRRMLNVMREDNPDVTDIWIEGIGSLAYGLLTDIDTMTYRPIGLASYTENYTAQTFDINTSCYKGRSFSIADTDGGRTETTDEFRFEFLDDTLHVSGYVYCANTSLAYATCKVENNVIDFDYFIPANKAIRSGSHPIEIKLPGFQSGTYTIKGTELNAICNTGVKPTDDYAQGWFWFFDNQNFGGTWIQVMQNADRLCFETRLDMDSDEYIGRHPYKRMVFSPDAWDRQEKDTLYYREENGRIYHYDPSVGAENIVLDFNLKPGDVFKCMDGESWRVIELSQTTMMGKKKKVIYLENVNHKGVTDKWIETVGSQTYGLFTDRTPDKDKSIGISTALPHTFEIATPNYKGKAVPVSDTELNGEELGLHYEFVGKDLRIYGYIRTAFIDFIYLTVRIHNGNITVFGFNPSPIRLTGWSYSKIDVMFSDFEPCVYNIKELDETGVAIKEFTLECKGTTGIENLSPTPSPSRNGGELYDLQGRRLMKAPEKGLYIQDGKIKMIK